ncbi:Fms-interacting protein-domain-containing protein [Sphaerosporella brunnea]|uniref:Fms-interacting protein-domain-containing protein n=1 Tax=Sphaerosporella brunnea TaxID=1250544 RepID=A0A5J5EVD4_9PEZI|nr:Fms-interacting protein-domain-containing protein [Sphaerosporella brunnea]
MTIQHAAIDQDHTVAHCLEVAERTRQLCHEIISALEAASDGEPSEQVQIERSRQRKQLNALVMQLKSLHRSAIMSSREAKEATGKARQEVDRLHLQLQNLYYEQRHLRGEINACKDFPHKYTSLPLIPEEEFLSQHPEFQQTDPHNLMIARLKNEKVVREELEKQRKELLIKKQALIAENKKRKDDLDSLDEQLKKFIESSRSIQTTFQKDY